MAGRAGHNAGPDWPSPGADHPSWPARDASGWQQAADDPSWPAGADWPQPGTDYPSWPANGPGTSWVPTGGEAGRPQRGAPTAVHHDQRWQAPAPVPPRAPAPVTRWEYPARAAGAHAKTGGWSAKLARAQDTATKTYYELAFGDGRLQVMLTEPPAASQGWAAGGHARQVEVLESPGGQAAWAAEDQRNADAVRVAERILSDAKYQAGEIRHEASGQATAIREAAEQEAAEIRQQAAAQAAPVREAAEREAAEIRVQAAAQAAAIREAAEHEAAELRAHLLDMSAELGRVAAWVTENLTSPAIPATKPAARPVAEPVVEPAAAPETKPATRSVTRPATQPAAKPVAKPAARPRQFFAVRKVAIGATVLVIFAVAAGATEVAQHGFRFFVFREGGTGSTPGSVINDQQFLAKEKSAAAPGHKVIPGPAGKHHAPKAHHHPNGKHHHPNGKHHHPNGKKAGK